MVKRQDGKAAVLGREFLRDAHSPASGQQAGVRVNHALRPPGCARGVHQQRVVTRGNFMQGRACVLWLIKRYTVGAHGLKHLQLVWMYKGEGCLRMLQRIANGLWPRSEIDHRHPKAAIKHGIKRLGTFQPVGMYNRNTVTFGNATCGQIASDSRGMFA